MYIFAQFMNIYAKDQKKKQREEWGSKTVTPILEYLKEMINNLSETISYIHERSKNFKDN